MFENPVVKFDDLNQQQSRSWYKAQIKDAKIHIKGSFYKDSICYENNIAAFRLVELLKLNTHDDLFLKDIASVLKNLRGHYSFIIETPYITIAAVDRIRTYPIYYSEHKNVFISNSASIIQKECGLKNIDNLSHLEFRMSGFVTDRNTLFSGLYQLLPGEFVYYEKDSKQLQRSRYYQYLPNAKEVNDISENTLMEEMHSVHLHIFNELIESLSGRPVWLPLSGGLDSRFILAMLLELKYDNITTFSYGIKNYWEIKRAKQIAEFLKVKWHHVPYKPKKTRCYMNAEEGRKYLSYAWGMHTVPVWNDYFAILLLKENKLVQDDAVFINGQSGDFITGGHIPKFTENDCSIETLLGKITNKHHSLWLQLKTEENLNLIEEKILNILGLKRCERISANELARYYEYYEWQERQCKLVVNGQRVYEWFGYEWRLPLWHDELMFFWEKVPWEIKCEQKLFKKYLKTYDPCSIFSKVWCPTDYKHEPLVFRALTSLSRQFFPSFDFQTRFTNYFSTYAALYPQNSYWSYLKESAGHRNPISYHARNLAEQVKAG
jgi:asparagine synthase (glutamine-hydrolysing)